MNPYDATEQAFKRGYEQGVKDFTEKHPRLFPKAPILLKINGDKFRKKPIVYQCPSCGNLVMKTGNYCGKCGQAFDWGFGELLEKHKDDELFCRLIKCRFLKGLTVEQTAQELFISERSVHRIMNKYVGEER